MKNLQFSAAFTLLEMIVVLSIIGLITAISAPRFNQVYDRVVFASQKDDIANQLKLLSFKAYQRGRKFNLEQASKQKELLELPSGWYLVSGKTITYTEIGVCRGGEASFQSGNTFITFALIAPLCVPSQL